VPVGAAESTKGIKMICVTYWEIIAAALFLLAGRLAWRRRHYLNYGAGYLVPAAMVAIALRVIL